MKDDLFLKSALYDPSMLE